MSSVRANNNLLFFDFRYQSQRCREYTKLPDTAANRKRMQRVLEKIEAEIVLGSFDYAKYFPESKNASRFASEASAASSAVQSDTPLYKDFAETWINEFKVAWRRSHLATISSTLDRHLLPYFGDMPVGNIRKADVLKFRANLATIPGRSGNATLSAKTINRIIQIHSQVLAEAGDRYDFINPIDRIKRLKQPRVDIQPFSLDEIQTMLATVRADYRDYLALRCFTGMRTGEVHGLKWKYIDFERRLILVRETLVRGETEYTKTDGSQRDILMSAPVLAALKNWEPISKGKSDYVFCSSSGEPLDTDNFTNRVWYPLLRHLGLEKRRPYQMRHTAATLWLASGENPEWVARQLGHSNTQMLFKVYSRFIPNLTRNDGSAFDRLVVTALDHQTGLSP